MVAHRAELTSLATRVRPFGPFMQEAEQTLEHWFLALF
jgi:hypothetical protein